MHKVSIGTFNAKKPPTIVCVTVRELLSLLLDILYNLIQKAIEEFMSILMHGRPEAFVDFLQLFNESTRGH